MPTTASVGKTSFRAMAAIAKPECWQRSRKAGIDVAKLAADLQSDGAKSFVDSWKDLLESIETKSKALK